MAFDEVPNPINPIPTYFQLPGYLKPTGLLHSHEEGLPPFPKFSGFHHLPKQICFTFF